ncbi:aromatic ring-opening dioxygenase LigA [Streptomyces hygroscopicus]|uniref:ArsR/SmtB family transcription factor n=1 Tax=Streptomyces hygroscopicus TaxID=1912 RepID=UPI00223F8736|nr:DUF5937 family protein [Streptomyces hygroscopicus]MCW7947019.1 aromatic ring-opening dioxygenase LigA [Streptomyces hygroscopicus]
MAVTLNLHDARIEDVHVGLSSLSELMAVLHILAEPDHHPEAQALMEELAAGLDQVLRNELRELSPLWARLRCRLLFPLQLPAVQDFGQELDQLARLPIDRFVDLCATGVLGFHRSELTDLDLVEDTEAAQTFVAHCERRSFSRGALAQTLVTSPDRLRERLLTFLTGCHDSFFADLWASARPRTEAAAVRLRMQLSSGRPGVALAGLSPTAHLSAAGSRVRYDKLMTADIAVGQRQLLVIPSVYGWPHLTIKDDPGYPVILHFAVLEGRPSEQISLRHLSERLSALASPGRMELCRHLLGEPITTSELAERLGMAESQVSRSLRVLRDAGLVESVRGGRFVYHRLDTNTLLRLGRDVLATVMR